LIACASFFVLFGVTQTPDGPFIRPHPGFFSLFRFGDDFISNF